MAGPLLVTVIVVGGMLAVGTVAKPIYHAPDEAAHVDLVYAVFVEHTYPAPYDRAFSQRVRGSREVVGHGDWGPTHLSAGNATPRSERVPFAAFGDEEPSHLTNQMPQHPPAYYVAGAAWLELVSFAAASPVSELSFDVVVWSLRLFSALLIVPVPVLAFGTARRLGVPSTAAVVAAAVCGTVPMLVHIGSAVNNDNLVVLTFAGLAWTLAGVTAGDRQWRTAVGVAAVAGLGLLTKLFAVVALPWIALAYVVGAVRSGWRARIAPGLVAAGGSAVLGGWWWVANLLDRGELQPHAAELNPAGPNFEPDLAGWLPVAAGRWVSRFWIEPNVAPWEGAVVELVATVVLATLVIGGLVAAVRAGRGPALGVQLVPFVLLVAGVAYGSWALYADTGHVLGLHGRYLYGGVVGLAASVAFLVARTAPRARWWLAWSAIGGVVALQAGGVILVAGGLYGRPQEGLLDSARAMLAWSPPSPLVFLGAVALLIALGAGMAALMLRDGQQAGAGPMTLPAPPPRE